MGYQLIRRRRQLGPIRPLYYTICPADNATAGSLGRRRAGQLRFGFVAVSAGHIVYKLSSFAAILGDVSLFL
jgi:hypothetical protein